MKRAAVLFTLGFAAQAMAATVVEFTNLDTGRYLLAHDAQQIEALESGSAGPGWTRTGLAFETPNAGVPVSRFVRTVDGAPQHFFTASPGEAASLMQPGSPWQFEGIPFRALAVDANGQCPFVSTGGFFPGLVGTIPVYRLFAGELGFGHRYTTSNYDRASFRTRGWIDEGIAFCATGIVGFSLKSFIFEPSITGDAIGSPAQCEARTGSCLAVFNPLSNPVLIAGDSSTISLYLNSSARGPSPYASLAPHYQLRTSRGSGPADERFFPWAQGLPETQLALQFSIHIETLTAEPSSHAYGHTTIEFLDQLSGHSLYFNVLAYGYNVAPAGDGIGFDVNMGKPIVGTTFGVGSAFGRSTHSGFLGAGRDSSVFPPAFEFRIDRGEFQRIIDAARTSDPLLSANPSDYLLANFRLKNETVGNAQIGVEIFGLRLFQFARGINF